MPGSDADPDRARVETLAAALEQDPAAFAGVPALAAAAGVGAAKLAALCRRHLHATPARLLARARIRAARRRLAAGDEPIADVATAVGFETLSALELGFRRHVFLTPGDYRALRAADRFTMTLPRWLRTGDVLRYLGRDPRSASERLDGDRLTFALRVAERPLAVTVTFAAGNAHCRLHSERPLPADAAAAVHRTVLRFCGLHDDPRPFERRLRRLPALAHLVDGRAGLTIPQTRDLFDGLAWVVAGQQVSLPVAFALRRRLIRRLGERLDDRLFVPPPAAAVARLDAADLRLLGFSGRKAEYLLGIARALAAGAPPFAALPASASGLAARLEGVRGLGPWSVRYLLMRVFGFADCVPVGDAALRRKLVRFFALASPPDADATRALMRPFAPYRSYATFHLWSLPEA